MRTSLFYLNIFSKPCYLCSLIILRNYLYELIFQLIGPIENRLKIMFGGHQKLIYPIFPNCANEQRCGHFQDASNTVPDRRTG